MSDPFKGWICKHDHYNLVMDALAEEVARALAGGEPFMFTLLGQSRAGKSELLKDVESRNSDSLSESGHPKVIRVPMPTVLNRDALALRIVETVLALPTSRDPCVRWRGASSPSPGPWSCCWTRPTTWPKHDGAGPPNPRRTGPSGTGSRRSSTCRGSRSDCPACPIR